MISFRIRAGSAVPNVLLTLSCCQCPLRFTRGIVASRGSAAGWSGVVRSFGPSRRMPRSAGRLIVTVICFIHFSGSDCAPQVANCGAKRGFRDARYGEPVKRSCARGAPPAPHPRPGAIIEAQRHTRPAKTSCTPQASTDGRCSGLRPLASLIAPYASLASSLHDDRRGAPLLATRRDRGRSACQMIERGPGTGGPRDR